MQTINTMQTRSQTAYENNAPYSVDIDFDEASKEWKSNKKYIGNSCYKYICSKITTSGNQCKRESLPNCNFCKCHNK